MRDDELDRVIDDVARAMTFGEPDARLAHRIAARIADGDGRRPRPWWRRAWLLVPAAAACGLLLAVFVAREGHVRLKPDATTPVSPAPTVASGFSRTTDSRTTDSRTTDGRTTDGRTTATPAAANLPPAFPPLVVDSIEVAPLARSEAIDIAPIAIDRIEISAMP